MALETILTRRSCRIFSTQEVDHNLIDEILKAAMAAPSAGNQQPWHFIVVSDRNLLSSIATLHPHAKMTKGSAAAILVCGDTSLEHHVGYWVQDCAAATQNILLAAHELGLGAVWCGVYPREERVEEFRKLFLLPPNVIPFSLIPLGYPEEKKPPALRYNPQRVHFNQW